ncbi:MAG: hypothetical protein XXXJIFNMEKO3_02727 [Candidatus Erwinia impunctatus]|nr:hypothetical protein XXXJIFNMEKO_02727 [Culicoides impunctatus]
MLPGTALGAVPVFEPFFLLSTQPIGAEQRKHHIPETDLMRLGNGDGR